ncbi:MAG: M20 family dipeptidase, partial [Thermoplasmata archaeon]|nr:M20 family dipeptidase [Thermoplasmata archaeon]NIS19946.1 M20 family dipeptidase [Thermoplasmata archaeon]NIT78341.1 M20 family dipeptidase [Thermoplasmata archaeon]NIU49056.1 M20 family dipeptidase [Thermoplasmata archaeon]
FVLTLRALQAVTGDVPVNVLFCWEGEEEIGCPHLHQFIQK